MKQRWQLLVCVPFVLLLGCQNGEGSHGDSGVDSDGDLFEGSDGDAGRDADAYDVGADADAADSEVLWDGDTPDDVLSDGGDGDVVPDADTPLPALPAAGFFVGTGGDDDADGTSHATRWATLARIEREEMAVGVDVWLLEGSVFEDQDLTLGWDGTSEDVVILGTYHVDEEGNEVQGAVTSRAEINGTYEPSCSPALGGQGGCEVGSSAAVPSSEWSALITVDADYVRIQDLIVADSAGAGIQSYAGTRANPVSHEHLTVENAYINGAGRHCILTVRMRYGVFRGNVLRHCGLGGNWADGVIGSSHPHAASLGRVHPTYALFENNLIYETFTEGVNCIHGSYCIFRGNRVIAGNVCYYTDNAHHVVIEHNECFGRGPDFGAGVPRPGGSSALAVVAVEDNQPWTDSTDIVIRNNRAAGVKSCVVASVQRGPREAGVDVGAMVLGNTCLGVDGRLLSDHGNLSAQNIGPNGFEVANNVFGGTADASCALSSSGWNVHHNSWSASQNDTDCHTPGTGDVIDETPVTDAFDWENAGLGNFPPDEHWQIVQGSAAQGAAEPRSGDLLNAEDWGGMVDRFEPGPFNQCVPSEVQWEQELAVDYRCQPRASLNMGSES